MSAPAALGTYVDRDRRARPSAKLPKPPPGWPELDARALHGIAGDVVASVSGRTEADPAGLLLATLTFAGASIGRGPHSVADATEHPARLFTVLVGATAGGRKGTVSAVVRRFMDHADEPFMADRVLGGFGSGEAVVDAVRDPNENDPGAPDNRLLVHENEFGRVLRVASREGSTLSQTIRDAWDGARLQARSRTRTSVASVASVALLGHITPDELRRQLGAAEVAAGTGNRILFALVRRAAILPDGGNLDDREVARLGHELGERIRAARRVGILRRDAEASEMWADIYGEIASDERDGLVGELVARAPAQQLRLQVVLALLDGSAAIEVEHVEAAAAIWSYCDQSVRFIFGDALGDAIADKILSEARRVAPSGLDGTQIRDLFGRHATSAQITQARELLEERGLIEVVTQPTAGRPRVLIFATHIRSDRSVLGDKS